MLHNVINKYFPNTEVLSVKPFGNGHINTTYKLDLANTDNSYILQRINIDVFTTPEDIAETHLQLQKTICGENNPIEIADLVLTADDKKLYKDPEGGVWRMTSFINDSYTIEVAEHAWQAKEAGNAFGWFAKTCDQLDPAKFREPIKDFHRLSFRLSQLNDAIKQDKAGRLNGAKDVVDFYKNREKTFTHVEDLVDQQKIPWRIVHNDTKINNLLFKGQHAAAVIDLDTVGPGILFYDYGDALRTSANTAEEDEKNLTKVAFNMEAFTAFTNGYLGQVKDILNEYEEEYMYLAPFLMTYIIGIRFLADYLNGDVYFKTAYEEHNMDRAKVQKALIASMESKEDEIKAIINQAKNTISV